MAWLRKSQTNGIVPPESSGKLGTFGGVFTPSILTILGVIMYLRFGWVVGNVGLLGTFAIVTMATAITFLTGLSISAIATDQKVKGGGAYYMISRSLGIESGGAVGIPLYFAQAISVALYTIGFAESVVAAFPQYDLKVVALVTTILVTLLALKSAQATIRAQYFIMAAIGLSLLSLVFGQPAEAETVGWFVPAGERASFWTVFAVFFPAVTGIMAGVNMSGDLENPGESIPKGTLAAIGAGYVIYMALPILLALRAGADLLVQDPLVMRRMAYWGDAILLGVWGATLSSAMGSILGAPRVLQALSRDGVLPAAFDWLGRGSGESDEPRNGTAVTFGVAILAVLLGDLNLIAPVLSMFFLTTYCVLNVTAGLEQILGNPSYRPRFRVHWCWSMLGAVGCLAVMLLINAAATVIAFVCVVLIYLWLERRELSTAWGDVRRGIWMALAQKSVLYLQAKPDAKNWRPHLLVLSGAPTKRWHLIDFAAALAHNRGLFTVSTVLPIATAGTRQIERAQATIEEYLSRRDVQGLVRVVAAENPFEGSVQLVHTYGLGALVPNTILLGASEEATHREAYCGMIRQFYESERNVLVMQHRAEQPHQATPPRIDVWWGGLKQNGGLMMILAYLLRTSRAWREAEVCVKMVVPSRAAAVEARANLENLVAEFRTGASIDVIEAGGRAFDEILLTSSQDAALVFMGMAAPDDGFAFETYYARLTERTASLPTTVFVLAAEPLAFREILLADAGP